MSKFINTTINDVKIFVPSLFKDNRGYFFESYNEKILNTKFKKIHFVQDNESKSAFGTLRGLHFQNNPSEQSKLVRVVLGKIQDVAVDLRPNSLTYKKYVSVILDDKDKKQLFIPKGFAHGFLVLSNKAIVAYKVDSYYNKKYDSGFRFNDPTFNIKWKLDKKDIIISDKDNNLPFFKI